MHAMRSQARRIWAVILTLALLLAYPLTAQAADGGFELLVENGQSYLPLVEAAQSIGFSASANSIAVALSKGNVRVTVVAETGEVQVNYRQSPVTLPVTTRDGVLYIAVDFFTDCLEASVALDGATARLTAGTANTTRERMRSDEIIAKERYDYVYYEEMVEMEDGVKLRTQIYLPEGDGPWPVALSRTPYGSSVVGDTMVIGQEYAKRGMGYIVQNCRGKAGSEGDYVANVDERRDGITTINWLAGQDWCDGIGLHGTSYGGLTSIIYADSLPEQVKAIHYGQYSVDRQLSLYNHGLVRVDVITGWTMQNVPMNVSYNYDLYLESARYRPQLTMPEDLWNTEVPDYIDWVNHPDYHDDYWNEGVWGDLKSVVDQIDIPITVVAGIYDHHLEGTLEAYNRLNEDTKSRSRLLLGNWTHGYGHATPQFADAQNVGGDMTVDTFNYLYNIVALDNDPQTGIEVYFVEEDAWYTLDQWPIQTTGSTTFYLTDAQVESDGTAHALKTAPDASSATMTYRYDPDDPKTTEGAESALTTRGILGSKPLSAPGYRNDVISFLTDPLTEELTIAGEIDINLFVSTDVEDTCFTVTVSEVMADGNAYNMRNALTTLAYRNDRFGARQTYTPGEIVEVGITTLPLTWNVKPGNRLRIDVSSSNFPEYSIHTNTAGNWAEQAEAVVANQVVYMGAEHPSSITFPTINLEDIGGGVGHSDIRLATTAHNVQAGDFIPVTVAFTGEQPANTVILNFTFDAEKFRYNGYSVDKVEGVTLVDYDSGEGWAKVTLMAPGYDMEDLGYLGLVAKEDATLARERQYVNLTAEYVLRDEDGGKSVAEAKAKVSFTTGGSDPDLLGDTNGDGVVDILDLSNIIDWFGYTSGNQSNWDNWYSLFDFNNNGEIDVSDIAFVAKLIR